MKFLHLADLHLDSPFVGIPQSLQGIHTSLIQGPYQAFDRAIDYAIDQAVDFVLIAGDIYNASQVSIQAQIYLMRAFKRLYDAQIPVVISHGNHDYLRGDRELVDYPDNVHVFTQEVVRAIDLTLNNGETARIYGFSYRHQWIHDDIATSYPINPRQTTYTIGLLHGATATGTQDNYAPFTVAELVSKQYDYFALGHIHQALELSHYPPVHYSGTPQGRHHNEQGAKGGLVVELTPGGQATIEFVDFAPIHWEQLTVEIQPEWQIPTIIEAIEQQLSGYHTNAENNDRSFILTVELMHAERLSTEAQRQLMDEEWLNVINPSAATAPFVIIRAVNLNYQLAPLTFAYDGALDKSYQANRELLNDPTLFQERMRELFNHPLLKKNYPELIEDDEFRVTVLAEVDALLTQQFISSDSEGEEASYED